MPCIVATSISNLPPPDKMDQVIRPGVYKEYSLLISGADRITVVTQVPPELQRYITLTDPKPDQGPRTVTLIFDFPKNEAVPPGIYKVYFYAKEIPENPSMVAAVVTVYTVFTLRSYSDQPYLDILSVNLPPVPQGDKGNFTMTLISRSKNDISGVIVDATVLDEQGNAIVTGQGSHGTIASGDTIDVTGTLDTSNLIGGIYQTRMRATYDGKNASYNDAILRVGTLTIDLDPGYTQSFLFNQTNKFQFQLISNWNKPLTNVLSSIELLGQEKRSAPETIQAFSRSNIIELYFDRTETPPGPINGTLTVTYQELANDPLAQEQAQTHTFTIPLHLNIVLPPVPAKQKTPAWHPTTIEVLSGLAVLIVIINCIVVILLFRKKTPPQKEATQPKEQETTQPAKEQKM